MLQKAVEPLAAEVNSIMVLLRISQKLITGSHVSLVPVMRRHTFQ